MIKGKATIQLFDEKTGEVVRELHEENMITNAVDTILNPPDYIEIGMDSDNDRSFNMLRDFVGNLADTAFRGVIVCRDKIPEDGNNMMLPSQTAADELRAATATAMCGTLLQTVRTAK